MLYIFMFRFFSHFKSTKKYTLVISGWWVRWFYALGILKWLEELGLDKNIEAIYWVSAGAIIASYRAAWYSAGYIFDSFFGFGLTSSINLLPKKSLFKHDKLIEKFNSELPDAFEKLDKKIYIWCTDIKTSEYILFDKWDLIKPLLGSMSIPWAFGNIEYEQYSLADGGLVNNFPVDIAKNKYPKNQIIWIFLNYFNTNQEIKSFYGSLNVAFEILLRSQAIRNLKLVDHLFYRKLDVWVLEINKKKMKSIFEQGYQDCMEYFKK